MYVICVLLCASSVLLLARYRLRDLIHQYLILSPDLLLSPLLHTIHLPIAPMQTLYIRMLCVPCVERGTDGAEGGVMLLEGGEVRTTREGDDRGGIE